MVGEGHKVWSLSPEKVSLIPQQSAHSMGVPTKFMVMQWKQQACLNVWTTQRQLGLGRGGRVTCGGWIHALFLDVVTRLFFPC